MEIVRRRRERREAVIEQARSWVSSLGFEVSAFLVGSYARGDFNLWSDVDIVLVSDVFGGNPLKRLETLDPPPGFQVIPLTVSEFKRLVEKRNPLAVEALKHGVVLRDDLRISGGV
ncbi:MAG: nucleotidyltransferase domain-containing protein [Candidatus Caldarchaeum sp.]